MQSFFAAMMDHASGGLEPAKLVEFLVFIERGVRMHLTELQKRFPEVYEHAELLYGMAATAVSEKQERERIHEVLLQVIDEMAMFPSAISSGYCEEFVEAVLVKLSGVDVFYAEFDLLENVVGSHTWIRYREKHYDAESVDGVDNFRELPVLRGRELLEVTCNGVELDLLEDNGL
jgi:hypothetical protein